MTEQAARRGPGRAPAGSSDGRADLLAAGIRVFAARGFAAAKTREILTQAGSTAPTLYHHFGSKAGLYLAVLEEVNEQIIEAFARATAGRTSFLDRLDGLLDVAMDFQANDQAAASMVLAAPVELRRHPELAMGRSSTGRFLTYIETMCRTSDGLVAPPEVATRAVMTIINGLARPAAALAPPDFAMVVAAVRALARGGLTADEPRTGPET